MGPDFFQFAPGQDTPIQGGRFQESRGRQEKRSFGEGNEGEKVHLVAIGGMSRVAGAGGRRS